MFSDDFLTMGLILSSPFIVVILGTIGFYIESAFKEDSSDDIATVIDQSERFPAMTAEQIVHEKIRYDRMLIAEGKKPRYFRYNK